MIVSLECVKNAASNLFVYDYDFQEHLDRALAMDQELGHAALHPIWLIGCVVPVLLLLQRPID